MKSTRTRAKNDVIGSRRSEPIILSDFLPQFYQGRVCKYATGYSKWHIVEAAVAYWQGLDPGTGGSLAGNPIPPKILRVWGLLHAKPYVVAKRPSVGVAQKFGEGRASSGVVLVI
ncbi:hypothetical protein AVEN_160230-1 [Araneus ventricosus]|uniref:Uncharacterized protein n=1 Tax=Araneus ventricosus TaxID=182803 RepID=A0A4Y2HCC9_ARAVE|nr:hypothetical protein AVEN_160230-1 [Araneus ventricosus]